LHGADNFYGSLFLALVVNAIDGLWHWLGVSPWLIVLGIIALYAFDKWSIEFAERVQAIEKKLGIEYRPPQRKKSARWWFLFMCFVLAVYLLGKSFQAECLVALGRYRPVRFHVALVCLLRLQLH
jgi:hypothetical protein